jgi:hypothetical protein
MYVMRWIVFGLVLPTQQFCVPYLLKNKSRTGRGRLLRVRTESNFVKQADALVGSSAEAV